MRKEIKESKLPALIKASDCFKARDWGVGVVLFAFCQKKRGQAWFFLFKDRELESIVHVISQGICFPMHRKKGYKIRDISSSKRFCSEGLRKQN